MSFNLLSSKMMLLIQDKKLKYDPAQQRIASSFDRVLTDLYQYNRLRKWIFFSWLWRYWKKDTYFTKGIYLYGDVGRGKSMIMNLFFMLAPIEKKTKIHFYTFMEDVHRRIAAYRKKIESGEICESDPILLVASSISLEIELLCFDEFMVTNIADAVILSRLFSELFKHGCVLVATSNVFPENLYQNGINRDFFLPFISLLNQKLEVISLDSDRDYRRTEHMILPIYMTPLSPAVAQMMDQLWAYITQDNNPSPSMDIDSQRGYTIHVPSYCKRVSRFSFFDLCDKPLSATDFAEIAIQFDVVFIENIPFVEGDRRDWIRRFMMLVDVFYERNVCLILSSEVSIEKIFSRRLGAEEFEFKRTISRLYEMFTAQYVSNHQKVMDACKVLFS
ncbi:MAG: cell division protein ZapE [Candidatus Liberibacter ctenarytainae]|uniref:Cell division protein ZapE n=1 Tax=Candidatus Liberibacter ctenarytainae TaxID=2020335 RepID=A0A937AKS4_9HYPH|nr:cell division protein ZapE [Candidatus Liberibacter ctenarytainae]